MKRTSEKVQNNKIYIVKFERNRLIKIYWKSHEKTSKENLEITGKFNGKRNRMGEGLRVISQRQTDHGVQKKKDKNMN